jgi:prepilin-type N-terminal cleavage/methylation domain-containing protein
MNKSPRRFFTHRQSGFSLVEMIGVLAIIAILAVVIVPKVFSTIASSRVTSAVGSVSSMKTAITDFAGRYGTIPTTVAASRIDDLLVTTGILDTRFNVKIGNQPANPPRAGAVWSNTTGTWVATGGTSQVTAPIQSRIICLAAVNAAVPGTGTNYQLDGVNFLPVGSRVVSAVIAGITVSDAREFSQKIDGEALTQGTTSVLADTAGKVTYAAPNAAGVTNLYVYITHQ